jgi:hypothetical protein
MAIDILEVSTPHAEGEILIIPLGSISSLAASCNTTK